MPKKLTFSIIVILVALAAVFAYQTYAPTEPANNNPSVSENNNNYAPILGTQDEKYQGQVTMSDTGIKTYANPYWGIEFSFEDPGNELDIVNDNSHITLRSKNKDSSNAIYIYINFNGGRLYNEDYESIDLKQYIEKNKGWVITQNDDELISINEEINKNNIKFYQVNVLTGRNFTTLYYTSSYYFTEFNKYDKDYIYIVNATSPLGQQIISSFKILP